MSEINRAKQEIHERLHEIDRTPNREMMKKVTEFMRTMPEKAYPAMREMAEAMELADRGLATDEELMFQMTSAERGLERAGVDGQKATELLTFIKEHMGIIEDRGVENTEAFNQTEPISIPEGLKKMSPLEQTLNLGRLDKASVTIPALEELASIRAEITGEKTLRPDLVYSSALSLTGNEFSVENLIKNTWGVNMEEYKKLFYRSQEGFTKNTDTSANTTERLAKRANRVEKRADKAKNGGSRKERLEGTGNAIRDMQGNLNDRVLHARFNAAIKTLRASLTEAKIDGKDFREEQKAYKEEAAEGKSDTATLLTQVLDTDNNGERIKLRLGERLRNPFLAFGTAPVVDNVTVGRETKRIERFREYDGKAIEDRRDLIMNETFSAVSDRDRFEGLKNLSPEDAVAKLEEWRKIGQEFRQAMANDEEFREERRYELTQNDSDNINTADQKLRDLTIFDVRLGMDVADMLASAKARRLENKSRETDELDALPHAELIRILEGAGIDNAGTLAQELTQNGEIQDQITSVLELGKQWSKEGEDKLIASLGQDVKLSDGWSFEWRLGGSNAQPKLEGTILNAKTGVSYRIPFGKNDKNELKFNFSGIYVGDKTLGQKISPAASVQLRHFFGDGGVYAKASASADIWGVGLSAGVGFDRNRAITKRVEEIKDKNWFNGEDAKDKNAVMKSLKAQALITDDTKGINDAWGLGAGVNVGVRLGAMPSVGASVEVQFNALRASQARDIVHKDLTAPTADIALAPGGQTKEELAETLNTSAGGYMEFSTRTVGDGKSMVIDFQKLEGLPLHIMQDPRNRTDYPVALISNDTPKIETSFTAETTPNFHLKKVVTSAGPHWELTLSEDANFNPNASRNNIPRLVINANGAREHNGQKPSWERGSGAGLNPTDIATENAHERTDTLFTEPKLNELWGMKEALQNSFLKNSGWKQKEKASTGEKTRYRSTLTGDIMNATSPVGKVMTDVMRGYNQDPSQETDREVLRQMMLEYYAPTKETKESWTKPALTRLLGGNATLAQEYLSSSEANNPNAKLSKETWTQAFTMTGVQSAALGLVLSSAKDEGADVTRDIIKYMPLKSDKPAHMAAMNKYLDRLKGTYQGLDTNNRDHQIKLENSLLGQMLKSDPASLLLLGVRLNPNGEVLSADKEKFAKMVQDLYTDQKSGALSVAYEGGIGVLSSCMNPSLALNPTIRMNKARVSVVQETHNLSPTAGVASTTTGFGVPLSGFSTGNKQNSGQRDAGTVDNTNAGTTGNNRPGDAASTL